MTVKGLKAYRIYVKCMRRKHYKWAENILENYGRQFPSAHTVWLMSKT